MSHTISTSNIFFDCPVCNERIPVTDFVQHSYINHFEFFVVWASYYAPQFIQPLVNEVDDDVDEDLSYEYLLNLCDTIGYHKVGIKDVDQVAPIVITDQNYNAPDKNEDNGPNGPDEAVCTICLDTLHHYVLKRRIGKCGHEFCAGCIERWLSENKTCPVCIQHLDENHHNQIASISTDSCEDSLSRSFAGSTLEDVD
jgi:hypothetical protein